MLHFIYNPIAGGGRAEQARKVIEPLLKGVPHAFHATAGKGAATPWLVNTVEWAWRTKLMISARVDARIKLRLADV